MQNENKFQKKTSTRGELLISYPSPKSYNPAFSQTVKAEDAENTLKHVARRKSKLPKLKVLI